MENLRRNWISAAQNDAIRKNYVEAKIDKTQQNSKCRLYGDRDEMIKSHNNECCKLAQREYKTKQDEKRNPLGFAKKMKFDYMNQWYMHNPESVLENERRNVCQDFKIQTYHLIPARRPDLVIVNKKENLSNCGLCRPSRPQSKTKRKRKERWIYNLSRELKNYETWRWSYIWRSWNNPPNDY